MSVDHMKLTWSGWLDRCDRWARVGVAPGLIVVCSIWISGHWRASLRYRDNPKRVREGEVNPGMSAKGKEQAEAAARELEAVIAADKAKEAK